MKVIIYSNKLFLKAILTTQIIVAFSILVLVLLSFLKEQFIATDEYIKAIVIIETIIIFSLGAFYFVYLRGRKIEIDECGVNIGRKYLGPYKLQSEISAYKLSALRKNDLVLNWNEISKIHVGVWSKFWARHWNIVTPYLAGEKMSNLEKTAQLINVPAVRWKSYFLTIITKNKEIYAIEINTSMLQKIKSTIESFGKKEILENEEYAVK